MDRTIPRTLGWMLPGIVTLVPHSIEFAGQDDDKEVIEKYTSGAVYRKYSVDEEGSRHGLFEEFAEDGTRLVKAEYEAGQLSGSYASWYGDGERHIVAQYRDDQRHGSYREYAPDGKKIEVSQWRDGELHGRLESYHDNGVRNILAEYRKGVLHGRHVETRDDERWERTSEYEDGVLHGDVKIVAERKTISKQEWVEGEITKLDGLAPFPRRQAELTAQLQAILAPPAEPIDVSEDALAAERAGALRLLQTYRALCQVPHEEMSLNEAWFEFVDAASEVCRRNGGLSHDPPKPAGMDDELYRKGHLGAKSSNLSMSGIVGSVDAYMNDSDPSNIDRIGHRRWCLNPGMKRTAFGGSGRVSAMWAFDSSGPPARGIDAIKYPPEGWTPSDLFRSRYAWSVAPLRGARMRKEDVRIEIYQLDEHYLMMGDPLPLDYVGVAGSGYGSGPCLIFRPEELRVGTGERYRCRISLDGGKRFAYDYVVEFCDPIRDMPDRGRRGWRGR